MYCFYLRRFSESRSSSGFSRSVRLSETFGVSSLCNLQLQKFSFFFFQTLPNDCSHIEDVHLLFFAHFTFFSFLRAVKFRHFFHGCQVCVICNSNGIHSLSFKLCIMSVHILKMCPYHKHISPLFLIIEGC